jgi:SAM-dependent methyltransferase
MSRTTNTDHVAPWLACLVREHRGRFDLPNLRVHPDDDMYRWSRQHCPTPAIGAMAYFRAGMVISDTVRDLATQWCPSGPARLLDFACGYGRSLRFTIQDFGRDRVWGSEILPEAVAFIGDELGAHGVMSTTRPDDLEMDGGFDVIFVSSLFSHLPERTFTSWLGELHRRLAPDGLLVFSVHDELLLPAGAQLSPAGIYFRPSSEVEALDVEDYGATVVSERFVSCAIDLATGHDVYRRFPKALCFEQDLYVVPARPDADLQRLSVRHGPQGAIDGCHVVEGRITALGWAATQDPDVTIREVEIRIDDRLSARTRPSESRPDVATSAHAEADVRWTRSGWRVTFDVPVGVEPSSVVTGTAQVTDGRRRLFWSSELRDLLPPGHEANLSTKPFSATSKTERVWRFARRAGRRLARALRSIPNRSRRLRRG